VEGAIGKTGTSVMLRKIVERAWKALDRPSYERMRINEGCEKGGEREWFLLDVLASPSRNALDVGANGGAYSLKLANIVLKVIAVEPQPDLCSSIKRLAVKNIEVMNCAISSDRIEKTIFIPLRSDGTLSKPCASFIPPDGDATSFEVACVTLNDFVAEDIGFVKIDVEGHELDVLACMDKLVECCRPTFVIEIEDRGEGNVERIHKIFQNVHYRGVFIDHLWRMKNIVEYQSSLQEPLLLSKKQPRFLSPYVNNFIFIPEEDESKFDLLESSLRRIREKL